MNFQEIVIYVALVIMIIALIVVFMMLYYSSDNNQFPPVIGKCPDFFIIKNSDTTNQEVCYNFAGIGNKSYTRLPQNSPLTATEACNLKNELSTNRQTWDGITNNPKICN